jgi:hypothetical protein
MKRNVWDITKAFIIGFVVVAVVLLVLNLVAPMIGIQYDVGWGETFSLDKGSAQVIHASWIMPIVVGVLFAVVEMFEHFESSLSKLYKQSFKTDMHKRLFAIVWHGVWGLALGFVISMFLFALLIGMHGNYSIPFLLDVSVAGSSVTGSTTIISLSIFFGLVYGVWNTRK